jgi:antitoxin MazE
MSMTISKWGNSLGIRIPMGVAKEAGIGLGAPVRVLAQKGRIVVEPVMFDLESLVKGITPQNRHNEIETGPAVGEEAW